MILKLIIVVYFVFFVFTTLFFVLGVLIEKQLDNCNPIKKWWRKHIIDYDPREPRPDGTICQDEG